MKKKLYIIGAGSVGGHIAMNLNEYTDEFEIEGFFDDDPEKLGTELYGFEVLGEVQKAVELENSAVVIGIAFPKIKRQIIQKLSVNSSLVYPALIHKRAWLSNGVSVGRGSIIYPGTTINFGSEIGNFVIINMNCSLGHHTTVGIYSSLAPGVNIGGHSVFEEAVDVGIGVSTIQNIRVGADCYIGGQSMIIRNVEPGVTVAGVPARVIS